MPSTFKQRHHKNKTIHHTNTNRFSSTKTKQQCNRINHKSNTNKQNNPTQPRPQTPTQKQITTYYTISLYTLYQTIHNIHYTPFVIHL